jgi:putative transposase
MTPEAVHYGFAALLLERRQATLRGACTAHPERFVRKPPTPPVLPKAVWINPPSDVESEALLLH